MRYIGSKSMNGRGRASGQVFDNDNHKMHHKQKKKRRSSRDGNFNIFHTEWVSSVLGLAPLFSLHKIAEYMGL